MDRPDETDEKPGRREVGNRECALCAGGGEHARKLPMRAAQCVTEPNTVPAKVFVDS
jgi:hypothetical protein